MPIRKIRAVRRHASRFLLNTISGSTQQERATTGCKKVLRCNGHKQGVRNQTVKIARQVSSPHPGASWAKAG